jgi:nucleotide-binding universal stress UspA family protein
MYQSILKDDGFLSGLDPFEDMTMFKIPKFEKILFATDLSQNAEHAFAYAVGMALANGAQVTTLYVVDKMTPNAELLLATMLGYGSMDEFRRNSEIDLIARIRTYIAEFCVKAADEVPACARILGQILVEPGKVVERILHHAGTGTYDVVVMGSRGHGIVKEALLGGNSRRVLIHSPIPVLMVPMRE